MAPSLNTSASMKRSEVIRFKVLSMGSSSVGKSCLIKWFCDQKFVAQYIPTVGIDYGVKQLVLGDRTVHLYFFDLAGSPDYRAVRESFYQTTHAGVLMYDTSRPETFLELSSWLAEAESSGGDFGVIIVVANFRPGPQQVPSETGRQWAEQHGFTFVEVTLPRGDGVDYVFYRALHDLLERNPAATAPAKAHIRTLLLQSTCSGSKRGLTPQ